MKVLTLQITADNFQKILKGEQKTETRVCNTQKLIDRYFFINEEGEYQLKKIDAIRLINGRKHPIPELLVKVVDSGYFDFQENGEQLTYEQDGEEYPIIGVEYDLGEIIEHKNTERFFKKIKTIKN